MATPGLQELENDFLSGRNPLAYVPLCNALRKQRNYTRALEFAQRGLAGDPDSIAGRTLLSRLLIDLGHYEDALREIQKSETQAPDAQGLMKEKARCLLKLDRINDAEVVLERLIERNPFDPDVQMLNTRLRQLRTSSNIGNSRRLEDAPRLVKLSNKEILAEIFKQMRTETAILSLAVVPTGAGEPALEGDPTPIEAAYSFYKGSLKACKEMDEGAIRIGLIETEKSQLIVLVRKNTLVSLCIEPTARFLKIFHRLLSVVSELIPEAPAESVGL